MVTRPGNTRTKSYIEIRIEIWKSKGWTPDAKGSRKMWEDCDNKVMLLSEK